MTTAQLKANRGVWRAREKFDYRRWGYWHGNRSRFNAWKRLELRRKWWNAYAHARDKRAWYDKEIAKRQPVLKEGLVMYDGHPTAAWIVPILNWARHVGNGHEKWTGVVVSGFRTRAQQWAAAVRYGLSHYANRNPFFSNHLKYIWPGGAVDVTNAEQLHRVLKSYPGPRHLLWAFLTIGDEPHFSANAH